MILACAPAGASERPPTPAVDFEAEYFARQTADERPSPMYIRRSGGWYRYDVERLQPHLRTYAFSREGYAGGIFIFETGAARVAMRVASLTGGRLYDLWGKRGTRLGGMEIAGEHCDRWRIVPDPPDVKTSSGLILCVTADGVPLYKAWEDQPKRELLRAVTVQRRPQKPTWFNMPTGLKLRDVPDMASYEREIGTWATSLTTKPRPK